MRNRWLVPIVISFICLPTTIGASGCRDQNDISSCIKKAFEDLSARVYPKKEEEKKPNIMIILADDLGTGDIPGYWDSNQVSMPNVEELINKGLVFTDAHSTPLCAPSRYTILSGNYQHRGKKYAGTFHLNYEGNQFHPEQKSIADVLREEGNYHTAIIGKWHLGGKVPTKDEVQEHDEVDLSNILTDDKNDWSKELSGGPGSIGFDYSYITSSGIHKPPFVFIKNDFLDLTQTTVRFWEEGEYEMPKGTSIIKEEGEGAGTWDSTAYNQILVDETRAFLDHHAMSRANDPFFAYVSLGSVHIPHSPPNTYMDGTTPIKGTYPSLHMDLISEIDMIVGSLTQELEDRQLLDNTIIIFTSDNGGLSQKKTNSTYLSNGPQLRGKKRDIWEGGHRIPFIVRWDNTLPAGEKRTQLVGLNDVFATICDLVGITIPEGQAIDSVSFAPALYHNEVSNPREYLGIWAYFYNGRLRQQSIRKNNYKLIYNYNKQMALIYNYNKQMAPDSIQNMSSIGGMAGQLLLYDLDLDLSEQNNIALENSALVDKMFAELQTFGPCFDDEGKFTIINQDGETKKKTCEWVKKKNTELRCATHPNARKHCRFTCETANNECKVEQSI